jgi:hypothetical protein
MKWNGIDNQPIEGTYRHRTYDKDAMRKYVEENFPFDEVREAFEAADWDLEALYLNRESRLFQADSSAFCIAILLDWKDCLKNYWFDLANGHLDFIREGDECVWKGVWPQQAFRPSDIYRRLFFCETEEDFCDIFNDLNSTEKLEDLYNGNSPIDMFPVYAEEPSKVAEMCEYLANKTRNNTK